MNANKAAGVTVPTIVFGMWAYIALTSESRLPSKIANGLYSNRCCGTMRIANGLMTVADQPVGYVIEQDKVGLYMLPKAYVGASEKGFIVRRGGHALKIRLDDAVRPQVIRLFDDAPGGRAYLFVRANGS